MLRQCYVSLAQQPWLHNRLSKTLLVRHIASRFIAGEQLDDGASALRALNARGIKGTLNFVGTHVRNKKDAVAAAENVLEALCRIHDDRLASSLSIKLTQLGLDIDETLCRTHVKLILNCASRFGNFVCIDMEESVYAERTIHLFEEMRRTYGADAVGVVVQSYLRRSCADFERLIAAGSRIRLVKGGYWEPAAVAHQSKADVDRAFSSDMRLLLAHGRYPAFATHDIRFVELAQRLAADARIDKLDYEFQMLYGVRTDLQNRLTEHGYTVRCYVPYGPDWLSYVLGCSRRVPAGVLRRVVDWTHRKPHAGFWREFVPEDAAKARRKSQHPDANRVCIIGAGVAGIAAAFALTSADIPFDWFEAGSQPGGLWRYNNDSGLSSVYASLITNTSRPNMELFGYSKPGSTNDYLRHGQVIEYLEWFVDHVGLRSKMTLATKVTRVEPMEPSGFRVVTETRSGEQYAREYGNVIVAHGRNWSPVYPAVPGVFTGRMLHAFSYRDPALLAGKRVVIAGLGNSGADIVCDAADVSARAILSTRSGGYLLSRYVAGKPRDQHSRAWLYRLPRTLRVQLARLILLGRELSPKVRRTPESKTTFLAKPPVVNDRIAGLVDAGRVIVRPGITKIDGSRVFFADGSAEECDILVWATGYRTTYPFFSDEVLERNGRFQHRYLRVVPPAQPGLYFVGHISLAGPVFPVLEQQARWVADLLAGRCELPDFYEMERLAQTESQLGAKIFPEATRPEDSVEFYPYLAAVRKQRARDPRRHVPARGQRTLPAATEIRVGDRPPPRSAPFTRYP